MPRVACVGDNCLDVYDGAFVARAVGGNALNVAVGLRGEGLEVAYLGAVGRDENGQRVRRALEERAIDTGRLRMEPGSTAVTYLHVHPDGEREILQEDYGVSGAYAPSDGDLAALSGCALVHGCNVDKDRGTDGIEDFVAAAVRHGLHLSYDLALYTTAQRLTGLDIAFCSHEAWDGMPPDEVARAVVSRGARLCVVTRGAAGSVAFDGTDLLAVSAIPVEVVDTTGAGDSYIAAFLAASVAGADLRACMEAGSRAGAETCRMVGAWEGSIQVEG
jgi:fructoselysine 6-kinase